VPRSLRGFFSYSLSDDRASGRQLSAIREFLSIEVGTLLGVPFELFQDIEHGAIGRPWAQELFLTLQDADLLIPVVSPAFLTSDWCRREYSTFLEARRKRGEVPYVYPIYFVADDEIDSIAPTDEIARTIKSFQYVDVREFRVPPRGHGLDDIKPELAHRLQRLAQAIKANAGRRVVADREDDAGRLENAVPIESALHLSAVATAGDGQALRRILGQTLQLLSDHSYLERDLAAATTVFHELCDNVAKHVGEGSLVTFELGRLERDWPNRHEGFTFEVGDPGEGFDLRAALDRSDGELATGGRERGLLRAFRLGSILVNEQEQRPSGVSHRIGWFRELAPHIGLSVFSTETVVPVVFSWAHDAIRINDLVITFEQWRQYRPSAPHMPGFGAGPDRSNAFMDLVFDTLLRPGRNIIGIEIIGHGWTGCLSCIDVLEQIRDFVVRSDSHLAGAVVYADTDASEQREIRRFTREVGWPFFESLDQALSWSKVQR
jgi:hypothetical protein